MKNKFPILGLFAFLIIVGLWSCGEEELRGPLYYDNIAPAPVTDVVVTNLPGGAKISYTVPDEEDVLLVEASYKRGNKEVRTSTSIFNNELTIEGFKAAEDIPVSLVTVDRSDNRSTPVTVSISPRTAPIDEMFSSLELVEDFGGVRLRYDNKDRIQVEFQLLQKEENGLFAYQTSAFISNDQRKSYSFRGFPPVTETFAVVAIDRWDNITDTLVAELTPIEEEMLDIENFSAIRPKIPTDEPDAFGWVLENMWNNNIGGSGYHTSQSSPGQLVAPYQEPYHFISFDLGTTAYLSRLKFWQRQGSWIFAHGNPRHFEVWGTDVLPDNDGSTLEGWTKLVENGEVLKPSDGPLGQNSAEDVAQAANGEEFEILDSTVPVRYIRFVNFQSWSGAKFMHIMEINFWGKVIQ
jgi:hypothetical protein